MLARCVLLLSLSREIIQKWTRGMEIVDMHSYFHDKRRNGDIRLKEHMVDGTYYYSSERKILTSQTTSDRKKWLPLIRSMAVFSLYAQMRMSVRLANRKKKSLQYM
jgi:hypothetical protein